MFWVAVSCCVWVFHYLTHLLVARGRDVSTKADWETQPCPMLLLFTVSMTIVIGILYYHITRGSQWCMGLMLEYRDSARGGRGLMSSIPASVRQFTEERSQRVPHETSAASVGCEETCTASVGCCGETCTDMVVMAPVAEEDEDDLEYGAMRSPSHSDGGDMGIEMQSVGEDQISLTSSLDDVPMGQNDFRESGQMTERFTSYKIWSNVYILGIGAFCMLYALQLENPLTNVVFCYTQWIIAVGDFVYVHIFRNAVFRATYRHSRPSRWLGCCDLEALWRSLLIATQRRAAQDQEHGLSSCDSRTGGADIIATDNINDTRIHPLALTCYGVALVFHNAHASFVDLGIQLRSTPKSVLVMQCVLAATGPIAFKFMYRPKNMRQTIEVASPVAGLLGVTVLAVIGTANITHTGCIFQQYVKAQDITLDAADYAVHVFPVAIIASLLLPIAATCALVATISASNARRTIDVAGAALLVTMVRYYSPPNTPSEAERWELDAQAAIASNACAKIAILFILLFYIFNVVHLAGTLSMRSR